MLCVLFLGTVTGLSFETMPILMHASCSSSIRSVVVRGTWRTCQHFMPARSDWLLTQSKVYLIIHDCFCFYGPNWLLTILNFSVPYLHSTKMLAISSQRTKSWLIAEYSVFFHHLKYNLNYAMFFCLLFSFNWGSIHACHAIQCFLFLRSAMPCTQRISKSAQIRVS